jgi:hypothetical protein
MDTVFISSRAPKDADFRHRLPHNAALQPRESFQASAASACYVALAFASQLPILQLHATAVVRLKATAFSFPAQGWQPQFSGDVNNLSEKRHVRAPEIEAHLNGFHGAFTAPQLNVVCLRVTPKLLSNITSRVSCEQERIALASRARAARELHAVVMRAHQSPQELLADLVLDRRVL